jgi:hypothetical protein
MLRYRENTFDIEDRRYRVRYINYKIFDVDVARLQYRVSSILDPICNYVTLISNNTYTDTKVPTLRYIGGGKVPDVLVT